MDVCWLAVCKCGRAPSPRRVLALPNRQNLWPGSFDVPPLLHGKWPQTRLECSGSMICGSVKIDIFCTGVIQLKVVNLNGGANYWSRALSQRLQFPPSPTSMGRWGLDLFCFFQYSTVVPCTSERNRSDTFIGGEGKVRSGQPTDGSGLNLQRLLVTGEGGASSSAGAPEHMRFRGITFTL